MYETQLSLYVSSLIIEIMYLFDFSISLASNNYGTSKLLQI